MISTLERPIFDTIRYFDILAMPVTAVQIWRALVVDASGTGVRWGGQHVVPLSQVRQTLTTSAWLRKRVVSCWGYWGVRGADRQRNIGAYVRRRMARHVLAQRKWKILRWVAAVLARLPLVRMIGVTGSLALSNTRPQSDLDLLIVVRRGRIWTARLLLLLVVQLMGRRRRYWEGRAPDKVCLNHYIADDALTMAPAIRSVYTAMLYAHVVPLAGFSTFGHWRAANDVWLRRWLMYPEVPSLAPRQYIRVGASGRMIRRWVENLLLEPTGRALEKWAERVQRRTIAQHTRLRRGWGRIVLSDTELAFHPDSKEPDVLHRFSEEYGQGRLL